MRDKVILGVSLTVVLLLTFVIYTILDTTRGPSTQASQLEDQVNKGKVIFAQYCIQCHGPQGEGCIGPALNRVVWRPTIDGQPNPQYDTASHDFIKKTVSRGRISNQPGIQMPMWSVDEGGPLNDEAIEEVISFIQYGDWSTVLENAASANNLNEPLPSYAGFPDNKVSQVKDLMLAKGCLNCHTLGKGGGKIGADLTDVGSRRSADWLRNWVHDPKAMPPTQRGPNLWLVGPTATVPPLPAGGAPANSTPAPAAPTAQAFPMNTTYMPTIPMTTDELNLLVDYLSHARTSTK